jgi:hypothetical protein
MKKKCFAGRGRVGGGYAFDDDGAKVIAGDEVCFTLGIPPLKVVGKIFEKGKTLYVSTPDCEPKECKFRSLRSFVGGWYKCDKGAK